jgi:hypothetical protein
MDKYIGLAKIDRKVKYRGAWYEIGNYQLYLIVTSSIPTEDQKEKWGRNPHFAFSVVDLEIAKAELLSQNCPIQASVSGRPAIFTKDSYGNILELS